MSSPFAFVHALIPNGSRPIPLWMRMTSITSTQLLPTTTNSKNTRLAMPLYPLNLSKNPDLLNKINIKMRFYKRNAHHIPFDFPRTLQSSQSPKISSNFIHFGSNTDKGKWGIIGGEVQANDVKFNHFEWRTRRQPGSSFPH